MDPITLIVTALAAGASASAAASADKSLLDAQAALLARLRAAYPTVNAAVLAVDPGSKDLQAYVRKQLNEAGAGADGQLLQDALALLKTVQAKLG